MQLDADRRDRIQSLIDSQEVVLFMKGDRTQPQCGFSATVVRILDTLVPDYETFDVLSDPGLRDDIKAFSSWPTIPQLYVKGEFVGGCDIIQEMFGTGELMAAFGIEVSGAGAPQIVVTDSAAAAIRGAAEQSQGPGQELHLGIDARYQNSLTFAPAAETGVRVESNGIVVVFDPISAQRADGITIDVVETPRGPGFQIDNPRAPRIGALESSTLKSWLDAGEALELVDVRTQGERDRASIPGSVLLTETEADRLLALPKDTRIVFHCHHGPRAQAASEDFAARGFTDVHNLTGGIDAWSRDVDSDVPRY